MRIFQIILGGGGRESEKIVEKCVKIAKYSYFVKEGKEKGEGGEGEEQKGEKEKEKEIQELEPMEENREMVVKEKEKRVIRVLFDLLLTSPSTLLSFSSQKMLVEGIRREEEGKGKEEEEEEEEGRVPSVLFFKPFLNCAFPLVSSSSSSSSSSSPNLEQIHFSKKSCPEGEFLSLLLYL